MANWGYRVGAFLVDVSLVLLAGIAASLLATALGADSDGADLAMGLTIFAAWLIDTGVIVGLTHGQSLGKRLAGTRIVHDDGRRAGLGIGLLRDTVCRLIYIVPFVFLIDSFMPLGEERQSLRDKIVGTRVLQEPVYRSRRYVLTAAAVLLTAGWFAAAVAGGSDSTRTYEALDRDAFNSGCSDEGQSERVCGCAFDYIKARVPYDQYDKANHTDNTDGWPPFVRRTVADAFTQCGAS